MGWYSDKYKKKNKDEIRLNEVKKELEKDNKKSDKLESYDPTNINARIEKIAQLEAKRRERELIKPIKPTDEKSKKSRQTSIDRYNFKPLSMQDRLSKQIHDTDKNSSPSFPRTDKMKDFEKKIESGLEKRYREIKEYITEPKHVRILKYIILIIPAIIILYLIYANFISSQDFHYYYDIGLENENYLSPSSRVSEIVSTDDINYRNMTESLVYFNVDVPRGSDKIIIKSKIKDVYPNVKISLGAKDEEEWHYKYNNIYLGVLNGLESYTNNKKVYVINPEKELLSVEQIKDLDNIIIATDEDFLPVPKSDIEFDNNMNIINTSLRGGHTFYIYHEGDLNLTVTKFDLNWYENSDDLEITLFDSNNEIISGTFIDDDGVITNTGDLGEYQTENLLVPGLEKGVYKLQFSNFDGIIKEIKINTNKIVTSRLFLANNEIYDIPTTPSKIYTKINRETEIRLLTYHSAGIQNISYYKINSSNDLTFEMFDFNVEDEPLELFLQEGEYEFIIPNNDIIITSPLYFSFTKDGYFEPFRQKIIPIPSDKITLSKNVDYLITDYSEPEKSNNWVIAETVFDIQDDDLFIKDGRLSFVYNIPHLRQEAFKNHTIPIDFIDITITKPGLI